MGGGELDRGVEGEEWEVGAEWADRVEIKLTGSLGVITTLDSLCGDSLYLSCSF